MNDSERNIVPLTVVGRRQGGDTHQRLDSLPLSLSRQGVRVICHSFAV
jgi:hypothetical protein